MGPREFYETIDSTQDRAVELARAGAPEGTRVVARTQQRGRGRLHRGWWSPSEGGVYLSLILAAPPAPRTLLPIAIGLELRAGLREHVGLLPVLKWPNDLLIWDGASAPRKLCGILIDEVASPSLGIVEVVGVGINVRSAADSAPAELKDHVVAIEDYVRPPPSLDRVEEWVVEASLRAVRCLHSRDEVLRLLREGRSALYGIGQPARVDGVPAGRVDGIGEEGELWLVHDHERIAIRAGDVEIVR